jgi:hypothetical protein
VKNPFLLLACKLLLVKLIELGSKIKGIDNYLGTEVAVFNSCGTKIGYLLKGRI